MARFRHKLVVLGLVGALAASVSSWPLTAGAAPLGMIDVAQDDTPTDTPDDTPADAPADMPADVPTDIPTATPTATATPTVTPTMTPTATPTINPTATAAALQQVVQHSNDEQVQAIATRNLTLTSDTVTADHFQELTAILQDMLNNHVTTIALLQLDWGPVVVSADGSSAVVTTIETWRIVSNAGSVDYEPARNDYTLVLDNGTWKIKSDVQVTAPPQTPVVPTQTPGPPAPPT